MFSTSWCPHCQWAKPVFESLETEYAGRVEFRYFDMEEDEVGFGDYVLYDQLNPDQSIPFYTIGCRYYRLGNVYEREINGVELELNLFKSLIDSLLEA